ncbi:hypothetical protein TDB9533_01815 [Thalassocella blandensis]|nr:hypothetical protein TDB9533_01815 [Thalassocella blandensis]
MKPNEILNRLFEEIDTVILSRQHPVTGLLPASTSINIHGDYTDAWVRDNVYSILCVWALSMAYKRTGEKVRHDQLEQATIKLMRGLLQAMMRQSHKVEAFKHTLNPQDALHAKYDTTTGLPVVADDAWGHLQIDATSLFLLMMAQMTASGMRIVCTYNEVDFVQNLVYYIASAYRTPDFGIWERGNKINNGKTEINASSLGMAKAALQALDGFNLFGENASPRAVIHTVADAISLARNTLATLLPRESLSKEVDSALLSIIGYPAFAVGDEKLVTKTRDEILSKLGGNYGCKRFLWDGHQTAIEESSRIYYEHSELANFENVESEWPLFYTYLYINALFNDNETTAQHYREKIESLMIEIDGIGLIPELYYLQREHIAAEKAEPRSQPRVPNENVPLVWAQSMYLTALLLDEGLITKQDIDPLRMRNRSTRFVKPQIALVVLAENENVKQLLAKKGVISECIDDIHPVEVISAPHLVDAYAQLGACDALGLTGRPARRLQSLSTSQTYNINGKEYLCLSWIQSNEGDYRAYDAKRMAYKIDQEISHIRRHWLNNEVAVFTFMVEQRLCETPNANVIYSTLKEFQLRTKNESVGYASAKLACRASRTHHFNLPRYCVTPMTSRAYSPVLSLIERIPGKLKGVGLEFVSRYTAQQAHGIESLDELQYREVKRLLKERHLNDSVSTEENFTIANLIQLVYEKACEDNHWVTARYCFAVLNRTQSVLYDGMLLLHSRHLSVVVGLDNNLRLDGEHYNSNSDIVTAINNHIEEPLECVLVQEVLVIIGSIARLHPKLLDGLRSIHTHHLLALCAKCEEKNFNAVGLPTLAKLSPADLTDKILGILESQRKVFIRGVKFSYVQEESAAELYGIAEEAHALDTDWLEWRSARGLITRFDEEFLKNIWQSLSHSPQIIFGDMGSQECTLDSEYTQSSMTSGEESFGRLIDQLTQHVHPPYYKSAIVETLFAFTQYCQANVDTKFEHPINLGAVLEKAANLYVAENGKDSESSRDLDVLIDQSPFAVQQYLKMAFSWYATLVEEPELPVE